MKKIYLLLFLFITAMAQAQNAVPNGSFEFWTSANYENPQNYIQTSNSEAFFKSKAPFNCVKTTDAFHGSYALKLTTVAGMQDTTMGYAVNCDPQNGNPCSWKGGIPYNQKPTGFRGHYKSNVMAGDSAGILMVFKAGGSCLGMYMYKFGGVHSTYTPFSFTLSPALAVTPDTVLFAAISSDVFNDIQKAGSMIQLDSLAFTGVGSQPAMFNGDFENWQMTTIQSPDDWYYQSNDRGDGFYKTSDSYSGTSAIRLVTYMGDNNGIPRANAGEVSTGYNYCPKTGPCKYIGGESYTNQKDTLSFYYKYAPSGNDSATVNLTFKKNGSVLQNQGKYMHAAGSYTKMEVPFNLSSSPDTVIVEFRSSAWNDTLTSFVGSELKVDAVHFKSQSLATGIISFEKSSVNVYPNPSSDGVFLVNNLDAEAVVSVYNILGETVNATVKRDNNAALLQLSLNAKGIYFLQVQSGGKTFIQKVVVN